MTALKKKNRFWTQAEFDSKIATQWPIARVTIFEDDRQIGTYERNFAGHAETTFEPFEWLGEWFALYSPDYTSTRVMTLPDCKDLGGEEPSPGGFCPAEYYVPRYRKITTLGQRFDHWQFSSGLDCAGDGDFEGEFGPWLTMPTGFVAGCLWGDDNTWKLECIDLALAAKGQIVRTARYGHVQLVPGMSLANSLKFDRHLPHWDMRMTLVRQERRDVATGELIDPYDE